ncbi:ROK family protein [bacterium]|nr:ROK family protein [bacterium]
MTNSVIYPLGIDVGATSTKIGLFNQQWNVIARRVIPVETYQESHYFFTAVKSALDEIFAEHSITRKNIAGIGVGLPGCVDSKNGIVRGLTNMPLWKEVAVKKNMEHATGIPTYIDNDVNLMTIGELEHGAGKMASNLICCTLGTGVGGGIVLNGKLYRGNALCAGEIGHMYLFPQSEPSSDNKPFILEKFVGNNAIIRRAQNAVAETPSDSSVIMKLVDNDVSKITPKLLFQAAQKGCVLSKKIWDDTGYFIGLVFASVVNLLNPDKIVIGGGIAQAGDILFEPIRKAVQDNAIPVASANLEIIPAALKEDAGIYGAATYGMKYEYYGEN